ncbi:MAG: DUF1697 domain-containing protein [Bacteroidota bacterium]
MKGSKSNTNKLERYAAFLRGINVGGNKKVPMTELKNMLEKMGLKNVKTILASGNVVFDSIEKNIKLLGDSIEKKLNETFGFPARTLVYNFRDVEKMIALDPFKGIEVTKDIRLYVTLLSEKPKSKLKVPYVSPDSSFSILKVTDNAIFSVLSVQDTRTVDAMSIIEKEFGKDVTTRNWNTILKLFKM